MSTDSNTAADVSISSPETKTVEPKLASGSKIDTAPEEGECGFCLFMKGGGCKDSFVAWEQCVEAVEKNGKNDEIAERCFEVTMLLKKCMDAHADYYEPVLKAEKAAEEVAKAEMEKEIMKEGVAVTEVEKEMERGNLASGASSSAAVAGSGKQDAAAA